MTATAVITAVTATPATALTATLATTLAAAPAAVRAAIPSLVSPAACTVQSAPVTAGEGSPPNASGAGGRFALAGAKCERRLPARHGPAPEVPADRPPSAPMCLHRHLNGRHSVGRAARPGLLGWRSDATATANRPSAVTAHEHYPRHVSTRRRHLRRSYWA